jgi:cellulase/cellobiase CelA1
MNIIELARQAGINAEADTLCRNEGWVEPLEAFAALVEAAARADEREACAKVARQISDIYRWHCYGNEVDTADEIAEAIRARGTT